LWPLVLAPLPPDAAAEAEAREDFPEAIEIPSRRDTRLPHRVGAYKSKSAMARNGAADEPARSIWCRRRRAESGKRQHLILRTHEAQHLARNFLDEVWVGLCRRKKSDVALEFGAHGFEAFDLKLQQS